MYRISHHQYHSFMLYWVFSCSHITSTSVLYLKNIDSIRCHRLTQLTTLDWRADGLHWLLRERMMERKAVLPVQRRNDLRRTLTKRGTGIETERREEITREKKRETEKEAEIATGTETEGQQGIEIEIEIIVGGRLCLAIYSGVFESKFCHEAHTCNDTAMHPALD